MSAPRQPDRASGRAARVVIFHALDHARAAVTAAAEARTPLILRTAPGAAAYAGAGYLKAVVDRARAATPDAQVQAVIDCGDDAGLALAALRAGWGALRFTGAEDVRRRLAAIAAAKGARLLAEESGEEALDLCDSPDPEAACRAFFGPRRE